MLGREGASSIVPSDAEAREPIIADRLNRHVGGEEDCADVSEVASRAGRCVKMDDEFRLEARLWVEVFRDTRWVKREERVGLGSRTVLVVLVEVEIRRFWARLRARLRSDDEVLKLSVPARALGGAGGEE